MARIRTIKPEFFTSEDIVELTMPARLLYIALWCEADRDGRLVWKPKTFKLRYFPADSIDIEAIAQELLAGGLVVLYGNGLAHIPQFSKHQHLNPRESQSTLAPPPGAIVTELDTRAPDIHASARVSDASVTRADATVTHREEGKGREGEGKEEEERKARALAEKDGPPTPHGDTCNRLRLLGMPHVNSMHPHLLAVLEAGATPESIAEAAAELKARNDPDTFTFSYLLGMVKRRLTSARSGKQGRAANSFARTEQQNFEPGALSQGQEPSWLQQGSDASATI